MGKGLNPASGGRHIGYAAGTGILVYVDLIGHLILKLVAAQGGPDVIGTLRKSPEYADVPLLDDDFKFEIYTGFFSSEEAIALPLLEALQELDPEKKNFNHVGQLSRGGDKPPIRWTEDYFKKYMTNLEA